MIQEKRQRASRQKSQPACVAPKNENIKLLAGRMRRVENMSKEDSSMLLVNTVALLFQRWLCLWRSGLLFSNVVHFHQLRREFEWASLDAAACFNARIDCLNECGDLLSKQEDDDSNEENPRECLLQRDIWSKGIGGLSRPRPKCYRRFIGHIVCLWSNNVYPAKLILSSVAGKGKSQKALSLPAFLTSQA